MFSDITHSRSSNTAIWGILENEIVDEYEKILDERVVIDMEHFMDLVENIDCVDESDWYFVNVFSIVRFDWVLHNWQLKNALFELGELNISQ